MKEPQPHDSQNRIIEPPDYQYITLDQLRVWIIFIYKHDSGDHCVKKTV